MPDPVAPPPLGGQPATPPNGAPAPAGAKPPPNDATPPPPAPAPDPFEELLKTKPITVKNRAGKEVRVNSRQQLEHYIGKGFGASEAFDKANKLEQQLKQRDELLQRLEAGDEMSVEMLREALGPKWRQIVEKEAMRDFEEEERMKGIPPEIRQKLEEARQLKAEKAQRNALDQRAKAEQAHRQQQEQLKAMHEEVQRVGIPALQKIGFTAHPPAPVINRLAQYMAENIDLAAERGHAELPIEVVAEAVKADMQTEYRTLAQSFITANDFAGAVAFLGEDFVNFMRKSDLARLRQGGNPVAVPKTEPVPKKEEPNDFWRR